MKVEAYNEKLNDILRLPQFEKVIPIRKNEKHPVVKEEGRIIAWLQELKKQNKINEQLFNKAKPMGSQPPGLHGLAKVHKENVPMRPVLSMPGSVYHKNALQVADWLAVVKECQINTSPKCISENL